MNDNVKEQEIDLGRLLRALKKSWIVLVAVTLLAAVAGFLFTEFFVAPEYESEARAVVDVGTNSTAIVDNSGNVINPGSMTTSQNFVKLFTEIIKSSKTLDPVLDELRAEGVNMTYEQLKSMIVIESVNGTQIISMTVRHTDKELAYTIVEKVFDKAPEIIDETLTNGSFIVTDAPRYVNGGNAVSPNVFRNAVLCAVVALVVAVAIVIVCEIFNNKIKSEEDLEGVLGVPVIGKIPRAEAKAGKKYGE